MPLPVTAVLDTFDRANESPLSQSGAWTTGGTGGGTHRALRVVSNAANGSNANVLNLSFRDVLYGPNCEAYVTYTTLSATAATYVRLYVRGSALSGDTANGYFMQWSNDANGCRLNVSVSGTSSVLAQDAGAVMVAGDIISLRALGDLISVYRNGSLVIEASDRTFTDVGSIALGYRNSDGALNDFGGGTLSTTDQLSMQTHVMGHNFW